MQQAALQGAGYIRELVSFFYFLTLVHSDQSYNEIYRDMRNELSFSGVFVSGMDIGASKWFEVFFSINGSNYEDASYQIEYKKKVISSSSSSPLCKCLL